MTRRSRKVDNAETIVERSWAFTPGAEIVPGIYAWGLLGDGRQCETWLAWCTRRWSPVAIKLPRPDHVNHRAREALAREAARVGSLAHPGIQRLLEARLESRVPHLVFEYLEGPTLADLLDERGPLPPGDTVRLGLQIGSILHYLHGDGLVHLDVKPENVVVRDGRGLLLDFDLASPIGEVGVDRARRGSRPYMSPEQIRCEPAAPSMDLFALGATLYEVAVDVRAFETEAAEPGAGDYPQLQAPPASLRSRNPAVPEDLARAIEALLAPDPRERPQSAAAALSLLATALPARQRPLWPAWVAEHLSDARLASGTNGQR